MFAVEETKGIKAALKWSRFKDEGREGDEHHDHHLLPQSEFWDLWMVFAGMIQG